jgi:hypothetical protein
MKYILLSILYMAIFTSCQQEKIEIPDTGRKIVINGLITTDNLINVTINKSVSLRNFGIGDDIDEDSANVYMYQNEILIDSLNYNKKKLINSALYFTPNYWSKKIFPLPGKEYKIIVKRNGLPDATAKTTIPNAVKIEFADSTRIKMDPDTFGSSVYSNDRLICNIEFFDPLSEDNYYCLDLKSNYYDIWLPPSDGKIHCDIRSVFFETNDPIVEERLIGGNGLEGIIFSDKLVNGKKYKLTISFNLRQLIRGYSSDYIPYKNVIYFRLLSITKDYYVYIKTIKQYSKNYSNPLAEPVEVNSNVTGGYGIFTGAAASQDSIVFKY